MADTERWVKLAPCLLLAGCLADYGDTPFACSKAAVCPEGYRCVSGVCRRAAVSPADVGTDVVGDGPSPHLDAVADAVRVADAARERDTVVADSRCDPKCAGKPCGNADGCGGTCAVGSGCSTSCGTWQAVSPGDPWDDPDPSYEGQRSCDGSAIQDFGTVSLEGACRAKCESVAATCCVRDHRAGQKSCKAFDGKVIVKSGCSGCTAASCH